MNLYTATINIGKAPVRHEIVRGPDSTLTPAEILLLRAMHGDDSVYKVEFVGERAVDQKRERTRLDVKYGVSEVNKKTIERLFGPALAPLPLPMSIDMDMLNHAPEPDGDIDGALDSPAFKDMPKSGAAKSRARRTVSDLGGQDEVTETDFAGEEVPDTRFPLEDAAPAV
jgi:hypothetical protein